MSSEKNNKNDQTTTQSERHIYTRARVYSFSMYAWQRRSKKPLLPPKPTDFDDVLKLTEETKRRVLEEEEKEENALRLENASSSLRKEEDGRVVNGEEEEKEEDQEKNARREWVG